MPFVPAAMTGLMMVKATSQSILGAKLLPEFSAISSAVCTYFATAPLVTSTNNVLGPGSGVYTGRVIGLLPGAMSSLMVLKATSLGIVGRDMKRLFDAVSFGVCQSIMALAFAQGSVIGGGVGMGTGKIINLMPSALQQLLVANLAGKTLVGSKLLPIASAIAFGICNHVMTAGIVTTICVGAFAPPPAGPVPIVAPGPGRLI